MGFSVLENGWGEDPKATCTLEDLRGLPALTARHAPYGTASACGTEWSSRCRACGPLKACRPPFREECGEWRAAPVPREAKFHLSPAPFRWWDTGGWTAGHPREGWARNRVRRPAQWHFPARAHFPANRKQSAGAWRLRRSCVPGTGGRKTSREMPSPEWGYRSCGPGAAAA